ncbi:MAG: NTP transferase domain-containing protein [Peptococcaceae bacterium]|nr:NTP transferase domain-containing protein [Peptococcaceae bacterium]
MLTMSLFSIQSAVAVIMAGGRGERFWPLSRRFCPKQFLNLDGKGSLLARTVQRVMRLIPPDRVYVVTIREYEVRVRNELPFIPESNILLEPVPRDTAPCVALAGAHIGRRYPEATMVVLPADHSVSNEKEFHGVLYKAIELADKGREIVTLGIEPSRAETGYGYIQLGQRLEDGVYKALRFVEKPDEQRAAAYIRDGRYLWNSGIFVWKLPLFNRLLHSLLPELFENIKKLCGSVGTPSESDMLEDVYSQLTPVSLDYGILEKTTDILVVKCDIGWDDLGSWNSLERFLKPDASGNIVLGNVVELDTAGCIITANNGFIGAIGVKNMIIVNSGDAVLVCPKEMAQHVRELVARLKEAGHDSFC